MIDIESERRWTFIIIPYLCGISHLISSGCKYGSHSIVYDFDNNSFHCVVRMYPPSDPISTSHGRSSHLISFLCMTTPMLIV